MQFTLPALLAVLLPLPLGAQTAQSGSEPLTLPEVVVEGKAESLLGEAPSASKGQSSAEELSARPFLRRGELLEVVPGMTITQHAGGGKANQYFLRGLNLDHGTDFGISIDGMPVNMRTHAHGQGYADLNILIPEMVEQIDYWKGPYFADLGDLSAAGAAKFRLWDALPQGIASLTVGEDSYYRGLLADTIRLDDPVEAPAGGKSAKSVAPAAPGATSALTYALEYTGYDGPWVLPEDFHRWNGMLRYVWQDATERMALTAMGYDGRWTSSDQIPLRAIRRGSLDRLGFLDPTNGGDSSRYSFMADWSRKTDDGGSWHADAWVSRYDLQLFSNFTYFLDDPVHGDQFEQSETRWLAGATVRRDWKFSLGSAAAQSTLSAGFDTRHDWIDGIGLYHTSAQQRRGTVRADDVSQHSAGLFVQGDLHVNDWLRVQPGLRADVFRFEADGAVAANTGSDTDALVSPKLNLIFGPWHETELYLNAGYGFHSNDARGVLTTRDPVSGERVDRVDPLVRIFGTEAGVRTEAMDDWVHTLSAWYLQSDSELVYIGDAGTNEAGPGSSRYGLELSSYWRPADWFMFDSEVTLTHAEFDGGGDEAVPNSVPFSWSAGVSIGEKEGVFGALRARYFAPRPLEESGARESQSSLIFNARLGYRKNDWEVALDCLNLLDRKDNDIEYYYDSRLSSESAGASDYHIHPMEPRTFRLTVTKRW